MASDEVVVGIRRVSTFLEGFLYFSAIFIQRSPRSARTVTQYMRRRRRNVLLEKGRHTLSEVEKG